MGELFPTARQAPRATWAVVRWTGRALKKLAIFLIPIVVVLTVIHIAATLITGRMLRKETEKLRAEWRLPPLEELVPRVRPGQQNAADLYQKAFDALKASPEDMSLLREFSGREWKWDVAALGNARRLVDANAGYYALLQQAAETEACAFPVDWEAGSEAMFPHLARLRDGALMLQARAALRSRSHHLDRALEDCETILRMAEHAEIEPTLIGQLVAYAMHGVARRALEDGLAQTLPSAASARRLCDRIAAVDQVTPSVRAIKGEAVLFGLWAYEQVRRGRVKTSGLLDAMRGSGEESGRVWPEALALSRLGRPLLNLDELLYLQAMRDLAEGAELVWPASVEKAGAVEEHVNRTPIFRSALAHVFMPTYERFFESRERATASLRGMQIALALLMYKSERGEYPESLTSLHEVGLEAPVDPFTQQAFRYRREGEGFVVYSLGPDMEDDGGAPPISWARRALSREERERRRRHYDLPFRVSR